MGDDVEKGPFPRTAVGPPEAPPGSGSAVAAGRGPAELMIHPNGWIWSAAFSPDGALLGLGMGNAAGIVDVASGLMIRVMAGHAGTVGRVAFSPKGALLAAASDDGTARIWAPATGATRAVLPGHNYRYGAAQT